MRFKRSLFANYLSPNLCQHWVLSALVLFFLCVEVRAQTIAIATTSQSDSLYQNGDTVSCTTGITFSTVAATSPTQFVTVLYIPGGAPQYVFPPVTAKGLTGGFSIDGSYATAQSDDYLSIVVQVGFLVYPPPGQQGPPNLVILQTYAGYEWWNY